MIFGRKKIRELEELLTCLQMDASNNYKDAAQTDFARYCERLDDYIQQGKLKEKQKSYYIQQRDNWKKELAHYTHKEQKVTW